VRFVHLVAAAVLALVLVAGTAMAAAADPAHPNYTQAVQRAYDIIQSASAPDTTAAAQAAKVLIDGTGNSQPEIVNDLYARPPLYDDAKKRLTALLAALGQPVTTADPALAQQRMHDVMSMSRYDALHRPPSLLDRFGKWVQDRIAALFRLLFGRRGGTQAASWWLPLVGVAILLAVVVLVFRASRGRFSQSLAMAPDGPRPPADFFTEADRLAAKGDRVGAIRALCAGVAATLAGASSWEGSSLTVREIFQRAPDFASLRPLLLPFEAAIYGGRAVDQATYDRAVQVAAPFRKPAQAAAA
jgi:hypothetical protein